MKTWYVELSRKVERFGYVAAETRKGAIEKATATDGDVDGLTTHVEDWSIVTAYEYTPPGGATAASGTEIL